MSNEYEYHEREAGVYDAVFTNIRTVQDIPDFQTGELGPRWVWTFQDVEDDTTAGVIDAMTATHIGKTTRALSRRIMVGLLGRQPANGDNPTTLYGALVKVVYGPNSNGKLSITDVLPAKPSKAGVGK